MTSAIIVAAGSSRRMGFDKLSADLNGKFVLERTINAFAQCQDIDMVIVVTSADRMEVVRRTPGVDQVIEGGAERHLSVWNGLGALPESCDLVAVHDGARPLISGTQISACVNAARKHGAAASAWKITDTVKRADDGGRVVESVDRENLWAMETPQVFEVGLLRSAYEKVLSEESSVTDEVSAVQDAGGTVILVENRTPNPKITFEGDLEAASQLISKP